MPSKRIVISFPKVGRTWHEFIIAHAFLLHDGAKIEEMNPGEVRRIGLKQFEIEFTHFRNPFNHTPEEVELQKGLYRIEGRTLAHIVRDPRDVLVSSYFFKQLEETESTMSSYLRSDKGTIPTMVEYCNQMLEITDNFHRYEDAHSKPIEHVQNFCGSLGINLTEDLASRVVQCCSFDRLKAHERCNHTQPTKHRRGIAGGYVDYLTEDDIKLANEQMEPLNAIYGYTGAEE